MKSIFSIIVATSVLAAASSSYVPPAGPPDEPASYGNANDPQYYGPYSVSMLNGGEVAVDAPSTGLASALYTMSNNPNGNILYAIPLNKNDGKINVNGPIVPYRMFAYRYVEHSCKG